RVLMLDRNQHPRFAIGESSTPLADLLMERMAEQFCIPELMKLSRWGIWKRELPKVTCGKKRGFSYFQHQAGLEFTDTSNHERSLLVAASVNDEVSDTHWLRSETDQWLFDLARQYGTGFQLVERIEKAQELDDGWRLTFRCDGEARSITAGCVVDASGAGGVLPSLLGLQSCTSQMRTNSSALFGHFANVLPMSSVLDRQGQRGELLPDPFNCDDAAQHHLIDEGWVWMLRFDHGLTSVGAVMDRSVEGSVHTMLPCEAWGQLISKYPTFAALMGNAELVAPTKDNETQLGSIQRVSRCYERAGGRNWFLLPSTAGIVDPLHSTGIAHSLVGVQRVVNMLLGQQGLEPHEQMPHAEFYSRSVVQEVLWIDRIVACAYRAKKLSFEWFYAACCLYFLPAIENERALYEENQIRHGFLSCGGSFYDQLLAWFECKTEELECSAHETRIQDAVEQFRRKIESRNVAGLLDPSNRNRVARSTAPK
ncbi:MAG: hypothetical protein AAGG44_12565, partial [Planctomycetota bacterium]